MKAAEEVVRRDPGPASARAHTQILGVVGRHCHVQMLMDVVLKDVEEVIDPQGNQPVFQVRHAQQVGGAVHPGTLWYLAACKLHLVMCHAKQLLVSCACWGSLEALRAKCSEILAVPLTLGVAAGVVVTCALSLLLFLDGRGIWECRRVDGTLLIGRFNWILGLRLAKWVVGCSVHGMGTWGSLCWAGSDCCFTVPGLKGLWLWKVSLCGWCWPQISDKSVSVDSVCFSSQISIAALDTALHLLCNGSF